MVPPPDRYAIRMKLKAFPRLNAAKCVRAYAYCDLDDLGQPGGYCKDCYETYRIHEVKLETLHGWKDVRAYIAVPKCRRCLRDLVIFRPLSNCDQCLFNYLNEDSALDEHESNKRTDIILLYNNDNNQIMESVMAGYAIRHFEDDTPPER